MSFLCGTCGEPEPGFDPQKAVFNKVLLPAIMKQPIPANHAKANKKASVMLRKSKFNHYLKECKQNNTKFTDPDFLPNQKNLDYKVQGRSLTWKRASQIIKDCVMVEDQFKPSDICQGNIGDCYFLSSIAALAEVQERISGIFYENFEVCTQGIYKLVVNNQGVPSQMIIDDFVPVFAQTNRPVFCKPTRKQIWVMLIEKAWAKIKGSYGAISAGCPHEVLNAFAVAPCYFYQIQEQQDQSYLDWVWTELMQGADEQMPVVAGTRREVKVEGLLPSHAYTILDCETIPSYGKDCRLMRLRNPWGKTQYTGFGSQTDKTFWDGVPQKYIDQFRPAVGVNDGDFTMPFSEFMRSFESVDISNCIFGFSYEFQRIKMTKGQPAFVRLNIKQQHEGYITIKRQFSEGNNQEVVTTNYGHARIIVALQIQQDSYEYYSSILQNDFPDLNLWLQFKPGSYLVMIETEDPRLLHEFQCTFGYYYDSCDEQSQNKKIMVQNEKYFKFLDQVWTNHAIRMNHEKSKIGPKPEDWIKTFFSYEEGGYGYVLCNLQADTSIKMSVTISKGQIRQNGFQLMGNHSEDIILEAGDSKIFVFSCTFQGPKIEDITFPPPGFKLARIA